MQRLGVEGDDKNMTCQFCGKKFRQWAQIKKISRQFRNYPGRFSYSQDRNGLVKKNFSKRLVNKK